MNLELLDPLEIDHHPWQYVQVLVPGQEEPVYRAYSISSAAFERSRVQLHVRRVPGGLLDCGMDGADIFHDTF